MAQQVHDDAGSPVPALEYRTNANQAAVVAGDTASEGSYTFLSTQDGLVRLATLGSNGVHFLVSAAGTTATRSNTYLSGNNFEVVGFRVGDTLSVIRAVSAASDVTVSVSEADANVALNKGIPGR